VTQPNTASRGATYVDPLLEFQGTVVQVGDAAIHAWLAATTQEFRLGQVEGQPVLVEVSVLYPTPEGVSVPGPTNVPIPETHDPHEWVETPGVRHCPPCGLRQLTPYVVRGRHLRFTTDIVAANAMTGQNWFSSETMEWWRSQVHGTLHGYRFFVTSEQNGDRGPRRYTVRRVNQKAWVETCGVFMEYETLQQAHAAAVRFADDEVLGLATWKNGDGLW